MKMNDAPQNGRDERLVALLNEAIPEQPLPPGFTALVWRRIDADLPETGWLERLTERLLQPRLAAACAVVVLLTGGVAGAVSVSRSARDAAQQRYVVSVSPHVR